MDVASSLAEASDHPVAPAVFLKHYREIRDLKDAHQEAGAAVARAKKAAKNAGIDLDALRLLEKLADLDPDEAELRLAHLRNYAAWVGLPIGAQLDMFGKAPVAEVPPEEVEKQREHDAKTAGQAAGKSGDERQTNPHVPGDAQHVAWDKAWLKGHKAWMATQKAIAAEMSPERSERGNGAAAH
jgi:hypothetical protein